MIQANELRIGNFFSYNERNYRVHNLINAEFWTLNDSTSTKESYNTIKLSDAEPIPLTPELLEKCGFKRRNMFNSNDKNTYEHSVLDWGVFFKINPDSECDFKYGGIDGDYDACIYLKLPKYLHQLQNLFFALTGEELNVEKL